MWSKLVQSLSRQKATALKKPPGAKTAAKSSQGAAASQVPAQIDANRTAASPSPKAGNSMPSRLANPDPKEAALQAEREAVRASFQSDPQTVVAVIRAWLHEDAKHSASAKEDAKSK